MAVAEEADVETEVDVRPAPECVVARGTSGIDEAGGSKTGATRVKVKTLATVEKTVMVMMETSVSPLGGLRGTRRELGLDYV